MVVEHFAQIEENVVFFSVNHILSKTTGGKVIEDCMHTRANHSTGTTIDGVFNCGDEIAINWCRRC